MKKFKKSNPYTYVDQDSIKITLMCVVVSSSKYDGENFWNSK